MSEHQYEVGIVPYDRSVGDDGDAPGISQEYTIDDLQGVAFSDRSRDERVRRLREMRDEIYARQSADRGHDFDGMLAEADRLIADFDSYDDGDGIQFAAMSSEDNLSTLSPDERDETLDEED